MTYELCLEYGTYPLKLRNAQDQSETSPPDFILNNPEIVAKLDLLNHHFHQLFLVIECQFFFVGHDKPEIRDLVKTEYEEIAKLLVKHYPNEDIHIEKCYW